MKIRTVIVFLITLYTFTSCAGQPVPQDLPQEREVLARDAEALIQEAVDRAGITGLAGAVVYRGEILSARGYGFADGKAAQKPVAEQTLFRIGSVSKILTALAVMQLAEDGIVDLDEDIRVYLPDFNPKLLRPEDGSVTVRDLLTHHSGIPSGYMKDFELSGCDPDYFMNMSSLLSQEYLTWESGTVFAYNNAGYSLLGELVGTVSGVSYREYLEREIFGPAGMTDARVYLEDLTDSRVSGGFTAGEPEPLMYIRDIPAGSILLSPRDMAAFVGELTACSRGESDALLRPATLRSMFVRQNGDVLLDADFKIGLSFWLKDFHGRLMAEHGGTIPPFHSAMKLLPEEGIGIFLTGNDNLGNNTVIDAIAEEVLAMLIGADDAGAAAGEPETFPVLSEAALKKMAGFYNMGNFGLLRLEWRDSELWLDAPQMGLTAPFTAGTDGALAVDAAGLRFVPLSDGAPDAVCSPAFFCYMGEYFIGAAAPVETSALPAGWKARLGRYVPESAGDGRTVRSVTLSYDPEARAMVMESDMMGQIFRTALTPFSGSLLQVQGYGRNLGNVVEFDGKGLRHTLQYAGIRFIREDPLP